MNREEQDRLIEDLQAYAISQAQGYSDDLLPLFRSLLLNQKTWLKEFIDACDEVERAVNANKSAQKQNAIDEMSKTLTELESCIAVAKYCKTEYENSDMAVSQLVRVFEVRRESDAVEASKRQRVATGK